MSKKSSIEENTGPEVVETPLTKFARWFPDLDEVALKKLSDIHGEILDANRSLNLISSGTLKNLDSVHIGDCVLAGAIILPRLKSNALWDLQSGNGLPGLVYAALSPNLAVTIIEKDSRRADFVRKTAGNIGLVNVHVENRTIDVLEPGSILDAITRGADPLHRILILSRRSIVKGGQLFHIKGDAFASELASVPSQLFSFWNPSLEGQYNLPGTTTKASVVLTEKIAD